LPITILPELNPNLHPPPPQIRRNVIYNVYVFQPQRLKPVDDGAQQQQLEEGGQPAAAAANGSGKGGNGNGGGTRKKAKASAA
jgi:preprotein translocase subunit SecA